MPPSFPQYVTEAITGPLPDPPGVKLAKEGLAARHQVVSMPGIVTNWLELWEGHQSTEGLFRYRLWGGTFSSSLNAVKGSNFAHSNASCCEVWMEYHELEQGGIKAVTDNKVYMTDSILDLLYFVALRIMQRGSAYFSYGIAENLDDPKYAHYKYWSNPLETKLPNAPAMEIYFMYVVGIPTERAYVYELALSAEYSIPFRIDTSAEGGQDGSCLQGWGVLSQCR